ncbi:hypothetical protein RV18_GL001638 [Enterococcus termitis]|nr:hypothetical protein RV18_GL001638 [Enterococcus termitis]
MAALKIIGGKWRIPIIWKLANGPVRYNELKRQMTGITTIMLTRSLKELEEYKLLRRIQYSEIPPHVEYSLTEDGEKLLPALMIIKEWGLDVIEREQS